MANEKIDEKKEGLSIVIPVFNEREAIRNTLTKLIETTSELPYPTEIIVVDDGSSDGTGQHIDEFSEQGIHLVRHMKNRGYGAALKTGIQVASYPFIAITDADGTYPNDQIPVLFEKMVAGHFDMIVGARTGKYVKIPLFRKPAKWVLNRIADYLAEFKIPDLNSGLRIFRKEIANRFMNILPDGFSFTTTITLAMLTNGCRVEYVPINYKERKGKSKIRPIYDTLNFLQLIIRTVLCFNPLKIFLPISFFFLIVSFFMLLYRVFIGRAFGVTSVIMFVCGIQFLGMGMLADLIDRRS